MIIMNVKITKKKTRKSGRPVEGQFENSKLHILNSFLQICFSEGVAACTLQKVADKSGVALATVRYHFNLQGHSLSLDALNYGSDVTYEWIDRGMMKARNAPEFDPVKSYIEVMFDWVQHQPVQASYLIYFYYLSTTQVELPIKNDELILIAQKRVQSLIHEGLGMKKYRFDGDVQLLSRQIHTVVMGACVIALTTKNPDFFQQQKNICMSLTAQLLQTAS